MLNKPIFNILIFTFLIVAAFSQERKVVEIPLGGSANDRSLEMSSLTWFKDELVPVSYTNLTLPTINEV